jgi:ankyrin repeat protein
VIGCAAWLTNKNILNALQKKRVKIIINKEYYLKFPSENSDLNLHYDRMQDLFESNCACCHKKMKHCKRFHQVFSLIKSFDLNSDVNAVNCANNAILSCGIVNSRYKMHNKFLIMLDKNFNKLGVWTGSYNLSQTSNFSLENAIYSTDSELIDEYIKEFQLIHNISENYSWTHHSLRTYNFVSAFTN